MGKWFVVVVEAVVVAVVVVVVHLCICAFVGISGVSGVEKHLMTEE